MNWKPGDRAIIGPVDRLRHMRGEECTLLEYVGKKRGKEGWYVTNAWSVETSNGKFFVAEHRLRPIYDGNEPVTWESCVWQPKVLERIDVG